MGSLRKTIQSYYVTSYDVLCNAVNEVLVRSDVTRASLWIVLVIVITISSLIVVLKRKHDELFSFSEKTPPMSANRTNDRAYVVRRAEKDFGITNHKQLLAEMHYAASKCHDIRYASKCIRLVRDCPYLINVGPVPSGLTPFQLVCYHGHACLVEYMLAKGANPWLTTRSGENALCLAIYHYIKHPKDEDLSCLDILYNSGCALDPKSRCFKVILKLAAQGCHKRLTEWILAHTKSAVYKHRSMSVPLASENIDDYSRYGPLLKR